jgi:alkanesulfonate monooxygenase SsuD/methylene tetrahydromethanopterin reductase-like flavin-dependent oxidoreductase (luciferase family)
MTLVGAWIDARNPAPWARPWGSHYARLLELSEEADRLGIDTLQLSEHHFFEDGYLPQPLTLAAAIAARTSRVRIGTSIMIPALRHPVHLAEEAALVDLISDGRLELGLGVGWNKSEFDALGLEFRLRYAMFEERITEMRSLWSGPCTPKPVQDHIPLWGGVNGPQGARMVGRLAMGLQTLRATVWEQYLEGLSEAGLGPADARFGGGLFAVLADDPERTFERLRPHIEHMFNTYQARKDGPGATWITADDSRLVGPARPPGFDVLTPAQAAGLVRRLAAGRRISSVWLWSSIAGAPDDIVARNLELIATDFRAELDALDEFAGRLNVRT